MFRDVSGVPDQNNNWRLHKTERCYVMSDFDKKSTAPSSGHFCRLQFARNLLATAVSARPAIDLEKTLLRIHIGLHLWLRSSYKVCKKWIIILLNKKHSDLIN